MCRVRLLACSQMSTEKMVCSTEPSTISGRPGCDLEEMDMIVQPVEGGSQRGVLAKRGSKRVQSFVDPDADSAPAATGRKGLRLSSV